MVHDTQQQQQQQQASPAPFERLHVVLEQLTPQRIRLNLLQQQQPAATFDQV
jgi:hypothetical protein